MHPFLEASLEANREIAYRISNGLNSVQRHKSIEGAGGDISSGIDLEAEAIFVKHLGSFGCIDSEESGRIGEGDHTILLDPIDGSSNILSSFPYYGTSAALVDPDGITLAACVCNLAVGEIFFKTPESPALYGSLYSNDFTPYLPIATPEIGLFERAYAYPNIAKLLGDNNLKFRAPGAVALSLVYSLRAEFFLYVGEYRAYDFAAGIAFIDGMDVVSNERYFLAARDRDIMNKIQLIVDQK